ncbi:MAG: hypothetical protein B7Y60_10520 [Polaromonas sp. 35-63-35]|nr:MAG: hypothetical protein B7Y60_10520 [Polaromonas sp. 35-63-35]
MGRGSGFASPQAQRPPEGLEPAAPKLLEQLWTGDRGEASREPRPARPRDRGARRGGGGATGAQGGHAAALDHGLLGRHQAARQRTQPFGHHFAGRFQG